MYLYSWSLVMADMKKGRDERPGEGGMFDPREEDAYWREHYKTTTYANADDTYDRWRPAYEYGWAHYGRNRGKTFEQAEADLRRDWEKSPNAKNMTWEKAKQATRDAWHRIERAIPGDADDDGR
jgi:hypothetical protein